MTNNDDEIVFMDVVDDNGKPHSLTITENDECVIIKGSISEDGLTAAIKLLKNILSKTQNPQGSDRTPKGLKL